MREFLENWSSEITIILLVLLAMGFFEIAMKPRIEYTKEIEYKNKIIEREYGRNFESYEDYLVYRIENGK